MAASIAMRKYYRNSHLLIASLGLNLLGCGGDAAGPVSRSTASNAYWALRFNQHAITLSVAAPHNTIQLHAIPMTETGMAIPSATSVKYTILGGGVDTSFTMSSSGLVTARAPSYRMLSPNNSYTFPVSAIIASLTIDGVTLADTALVRVTATAPTVPLQRISIQPPADSLALYQSGHWLVPGSSQPLNLRQFDVNGDTVSNGLIYVRSSDPNIGSGYVGVSNIPGQYVIGTKTGADITFYVQLWYYGVDVSDSLRVRIGYSHETELTSFATTPVESRDVKMYWWPMTVDVSAPAEVTFRNDSYTIPLDATFDHPEHVHIDTIVSSGFKKFYHVILPLSAEGNLAPFYTDTVGGEAACAQATFNRTTISADSACMWAGNGWNTYRYRLFTTPGTYVYHTRFGNDGKIVVH